MIEIEKKFKLTPEARDRLLIDARLIAEIVMHDIYYDTRTYNLTCKDWWLRNRDGRWELKRTLNPSGDRLGDQYDEITDEQQIRSLLNLEKNDTMIAAISKAGMVPFFDAVSHRTKYEKEGFTIDLDRVTAPPDFDFEIGEIEVLIEDESGANAALEKIRIFAEKNGLTFEPVRGKGVTYLKQYSPDHYHALVGAGVVKDV